MKNKYCPMMSMPVFNPVSGKVETVKVQCFGKECAFVHGDTYQGTIRYICNITQLIIDTELFNA